MESWNKSRVCFSMEELIEDIPKLSELGKKLVRNTIRIKQDGLNQQYLRGLIIWILARNQLQSTAIEMKLAKARWSWFFFVRWLRNDWKSELLYQWYFDWRKLTFLSSLHWKYDEKHTSKKSGRKNPCFNEKSGKKCWVTSSDFFLLPSIGNFFLNHFFRAGKKLV